MYLVDRELGHAFLSIWSVSTIELKSLVHLYLMWLLWGRIYACDIFLVFFLQVLSFLYFCPSITYFVLNRYFVEYHFSSLVVFATIFFQVIFLMVCLGIKITMFTYNYIFQINFNSIQKLSPIYFPVSHSLYYYHKMISFIDYNPITQFIISICGYL